MKRRTVYEVDFEGRRAPREVRIAATTFQKVIAAVQKQWPKHKIRSVRRTYHDSVYIPEL